MKPTEILTKEHDVIKEMLQVAEAVCKKLENGDSVPPEHLENIVDFIKGFADKYHHAKEEDLLFKEMAASGIPYSGGPLGVMLQDHETGRFYVKCMSEAIQRIKSGDKKEAKRFIENARRYVSLLTNHIYKEDNILYPMGEMHLIEERQKRLENEFKRVEQKDAGRHEEFLNALKKLKEIYKINPLSQSGAGTSESCSPCGLCEGEPWEGSVEEDML